ncbi:MAG TPA: hypothetical protein VGP68_05495 [Gemmataceae bacterium]|nr:hypothetical protein [Gemmataceae bacterium]
MTKERTAKALAQFVRSMVSFRSKFAKGMAQVDSLRDDFPNFSRNHPNLDNRLRGPRGRPRFSAEDKASLVAFLKTLSDAQFLTDRRFADPFHDR